MPVWRNGQWETTSKANVILLNQRLSAGPDTWPDEPGSPCTGADLVRWFTLFGWPRRPFRLAPHLAIANPYGWCLRLREAIEKGPAALGLLEAQGVVWRLLLLRQWDEANRPQRPAEPPLSLDEWLLDKVRSK
jgi:hypothetical protein